MTLNSTDEILHNVHFAIISLALVFISCNSDVTRIKLDVSDNYPQVLHGIEKLKYLENDGLAIFTDRNPDFIIQAKIDTFLLKPEAFQISIALNAHPYVNGYYIGSESYIPAKDYITSLPDASYDYAFERQWMLYKMWGRLMYNPETPDTVFEQGFEKRFPGLGNPLYEAQTRVSRIPLIIASYWDAWWDFTLYSEGMQGFNDIREVKLLSMKTMGTKVPMAPDYMGIPEFLENENVQTERITPVQLADSIDSFCLKALELVANIHTENNVDLLYEVSDIKTWATLGMYFSTKLRAAIKYQKFLKTNDQSHYQQAVQLLELATMKWDNVVEITTPVYEIVV